MQAVKVAAADLTDGSWRTAWGAWEICLHGTPGRWEVRINSYVKGQGRVQIAKRNVFSTSTKAVGWAADTLRLHGARVFCNGREQVLERFLVFSPAPMIARD